MLVRTISGAILTLILLAGIIPGGDVTLLFTAVISLIGLWELYRVLNIHKSPLLAIGFAAVVGYYGFLRFSHLAEDRVITMSLSFLILLLFFYVFSYPKYNIGQIAAAFFGLFYIAVMISCIYLLREYYESGKFLVWLIFLISWGSDTSAYFVGSLLGKHRMAPVLSPKKSWEGAVGGVLGAMLFTAVYCIIVRNRIGADAVMIALLSAGAGVGAVVSMVGDLAASAIKRNYDIKDYSHLIPGHGGILDRFDSVIITAPIVYYISTLIIELRIGEL